MSEYLSLGFFQFDNLVRNRVPFVLLHEPVDFTDLYGGMELEHLQRCSIPVDFLGENQELFDELHGRKIDRRMPAVVMAASGDASEELLDWLEKEGFVNVHGVEGGWEAMVTEGKESP